MKFVSWRVRPGFVDVERICDMRTGRPVRVARRRRVVRCLWPVNCTRAWWESSAAILRRVESVSKRGGLDVAMPASNFLVANFLPIDKTG
jgi:hypothetical protein